jgi:K+-transporting ATPase KdpF subunit
MNATFISVLSKPVETNISTAYVIGAIIALIIFGYLLYALIKPDKF